MNEQETAEYCRRKGIYLEQLAQWRSAREVANDWDRQASQTLKNEQRTSQKRIKELEKELQRKEKALAEGRAVGLKKKGGGDLGGLRGRMISVADRRHLVKLIDWARRQGSRLHPACETVGICARTYQRWTVLAERCQLKPPVLHADNGGPQRG